MRTGLKMFFLTNPLLGQNTQGKSDFSMNLIFGSINYSLLIVNYSELTSSFLIYKSSSTFMDSMFQPRVINVIFKCKEQDSK